MNQHNQYGLIQRRLPMAVLALLLVALGTPIAAQSDTTLPAPSTHYSPQQVVKIVIDSLQNNDPRDDQGIATVFGFASPNNRSSTGPLARFTDMIKRGFPDMLNHTESRYDPMDIVGDTAVQAVWLMTPTGTEIGYAFQLGKQPSGQFAGMWMTEAVLPLGQSEQSGTRI